MTMLAGGKWIDCGERNPEQYGKYRVICVKRGQRTEDEYLWNGGYWVTPGGSPSKGVQSWWEQPAAEEKRELQAGAAGKALTLADYEARIHLYKEQIGTGYIGIGRTLNEAKEAKVVPPRAVGDLGDADHRADAPAGAAVYAGSHGDPGRQRAGAA